jgi:MerR family transcriptional regulator, light-induced transcriptional regulator
MGGMVFFPIFVDVMGYRIKSVAALTGLTTSTLRAWERRYGLISPDRTHGGYRVYTDDDVARLSRIKSLLDNGFKVSEAIALVAREAPSLPRSDAPAESLDDIRSELLQALLDVDRPGASRITDRLASLTFERRIDEILLPVLRDVGEAWACGEASVAQEHFATAFVREKLSGMLDELHAGPSAGREVVCAGLPDERHEIGLLAAAVHFALRGWRVTYLGADLPYEDLQEVLTRRQPALLCVAMIRQTSAAECMEVIERLRSLVPDGTRVVLGGAGVPHEASGSLQNGVFLVPSLQALQDLPLMDPNHD